MDRFTAIWEYIQDRLDLSGDVVMLGFTSAVIYKLLHGGLTPADATAYVGAVGAFGYTNSKKGNTK